jgi:sarcosine/dimethylglycine N-methyltransferase
MSERYSTAVKTAQEYYNSDDADNFYFHVWGGEDIHVGIYQSPEEDIATASERTVTALCLPSRIWLTALMSLMAVLKRFQPQISIVI